MKKLMVVVIVSMMASFQAFAEAGIDCNIEDTRCSAYELPVNAEVLRTIFFLQETALNLGQVTKGETVSVEGNFFDSSLQGRGKQYGILLAGFSDTEEGVRIRCLKDLSLVYFNDGASGTNFTECHFGIVTIDNSMGYGVPLGFYLNNNDIQINDSPISYVVLHIGGTIQVPSDATSGNKSGFVRIEISYL